MTQRESQLQRREPEWAGGAETVCPRVESRNSVRRTGEKLLTGKIEFK